MIEEVSDPWHGSDDFVSFRGSLFHIPRTVACETSSRSSCIFLPLRAPRFSSSFSRQAYLLNFTESYFPVIFESILKLS